MMGDSVPGSSRSRRSTTTRASLLGGRKCNATSGAEVGTGAAAADSWDGSGLGNALLVVVPSGSDGRAEGAADDDATDGAPAVAA